MISKKAEKSTRPLHDRLHEAHAQTMVTNIENSRLPTNNCYFPEGEILKKDDVTKKRIYSTKMTVLFFSSRQNFSVTSYIEFSSIKWLKMY